MEVTVYRLALVLAAVLAIVAGILVAKVSYYSFQRIEVGGLRSGILMMLVAEGFVLMGSLIIYSLAVGKPWNFQ